MLPPGNPAHDASLPRTERRAAGTASLSPELLIRLTRALRRPPPPDPAIFALRHQAGSYEHWP